METKYVEFQMSKPTLKRMLPLIMEAEESHGTQGFVLQVFKNGFAKGLCLSPQDSVLFQDFLNGIVTKNVGG